MTTTTESAEAVSMLRQQAQAARAASRRLAFAETEAKNATLDAVVALLRERSAAIVAANQKDEQAAAADGLGESLLDRLRLTPERVEALAVGAEAIRDLPDPIGETIERRVLESGLEAERVRVPLGVIGSIYESRPNVTIDIAALCLKSGNTCVLRGGKEAIRSNTILAELLRDGLEQGGLPADAVQLIANLDRALVGELLRMNDLIDLVIPRGGSALIERVRAEARMPAVTGGIGICHTYVDRDADQAMALEIVHNAKTRRVSICNALDVVVVHEAIARPFLQRLGERWSGGAVELRADSEALAILAETDATALPAGPDDFDTEFLAHVAGVRVVADADAALAHIAQHGSGGDRH